MKIALCFYGQPRNFLVSYPQIKENILDKYDTDIFFHCWCDETLSKQIYDVSPWRFPNTKMNFQVDIEDLKKKYNPVSFTIEAPRIFDNDFNWKRRLSNIDMRHYNRIMNEIKSFPNATSQLYSRKSVMELFQNYKNDHSMKYDFVIGMRFDFNLIQFPNLNELDKNYMFFTTKHEAGLFDDNVIICPPKLFRKLFNVYDHLKYYIETTEAGVSVECLLSYHISHSGLLKYTKKIDSIKYLLI